MEKAPFEEEAVNPCPATYSRTLKRMGIGDLLQANMQRKRFRSREGAEKDTNILRQPLQR